MTRVALQLLLLLAFLFCRGESQSLYETQPRLRTQNGNLLVVSAKNKNITLKTVGSQSYININGENLVGLVEKAKQAVQQVNDIQDNYLVSMQTQLQSLTSEFVNEGGISQRTATLESGLFNITKNVTRMRNGMNTRFSTLTSRLRRVEKNLQTMKSNLRKNDCESNPCQNGATCEDAFKAFYCRCPPGWEGPTCADDVNECARFVGTELGCQNGATCVNKPGTYDCLCRSGFFGLHCTQSSNNCTQASSTELCGHGICMPQRVAGRSYTCLCDQGWKLDQITGACTVDEDECSMVQRPACSMSPPVPCVNTPGSFQCGSCPQGYTGNGYYCVDVDECLNNNGGCSQNPTAICINTMGSRVCGPCPPGFSGDGISCSPSRPCDSNNGGCHPSARCYDNPNIASSYVHCVCPRGFEGNGFGLGGCVRSTKDNVSDVCSPNPCAQGTCYPSSSVYFTCSCFPGYTGSLCDTSILDTCNPNPCQNGGNCAARNGTTLCYCRAGFTGPQCQFRAARCGGEVAMDSGTISYSNKNDMSSVEINCMWHITVNESLIISGAFSDFSISRSPSCNYDWVQVHDGPRPNSPSMGTYCGGKPPPVSVISSANSIVLWYHSPPNMAGSSFQFNWNSTQPSCGGFVRGQQGTLKSPGFPGKYPLNRDCAWNLRVRQGKRIKLHIFTLQIQQSTNCSGDYIKIRDGNLPSSKVLRKICNSSDVMPITSSGSSMLVTFHSDGVASEDHGFEMTYTEIAGVEGCGGVWTAERGEITSPGYPRHYPGNLYCEYLIQLPLNERIKLQYINMKIEAAQACRYDFLEVREGSNENSPLIGKFCGFDIPSDFTTNGNEVLLIFRSDASNANKGFKIKYETACGGIYSAPNGVISSPNYPRNYPNSRECIFQIAQPLHRSIVLQFLDLEMERHERCAHDYIEIRDGAQNTSPFLGRFCGNSSLLPPITLSTRNFLWLKFKSDSTLSFKGFVANYSSFETTCGGIMTNLTGAISSPNNGGICTYIINVPRGWIIRLWWIRVWSSFGTGNTNCDNLDFAQVFDNSSAIAPGQQVGKFCGSTIPPMITSQGNMLTILFNQTEESSQFELTYDTVKSAQLCGGNYQTTYGMIKSPNFPKKYSTDLDCYYTITVPHGQQISLNFTFFALENSTECAFDYIEIRNGPSSVSPLIGKFCGNNAPPIIPSHGNSLWIHFHTDNSITARGFRMYWDGESTGCGGVLRSPSGHIESPNYPQPYATNAECMWKIYVSKGNTIELSIVDLDIEKSDNNNVCFDYLEVRDGDAMSSPLLNKYCDNSGAFKRVKSTGNAIWILFKTDSSDSGRGFTIRYNTECNNRLSGFRGVIESPNFPDNYPHNSNCTYIISAPPGNQINITFSHFAFEKLDSNCSVDYVRLRTGRNNSPEIETIGRYCSSAQQPGLITSKYNTVYLDFVTDFSIAYEGFRMEWVVHGCGGRFEAPYGSLQTPNYPKNYPPNTECRWEIAVAWDSSVELTITDLTIERSDDCSFDALTVYGGPSEESPMLLRACTMHARSQKVTSSSRYMTVYFKSDHSLSGKGFYAYYREVPTTCGGRMTANEGGLHSKNYPDNFEKSSDCTWQIDVDPNYTVKLEFTDFNVPRMGNNCDSQYVAVYDGNSRRSPLLIKHCGDQIPPIINSTSNVITVRMVTNGTGETAKGFMANYQIACGATIYAKYRGELKSVSINPRSNMFGNAFSDNCTWIIIANDSSSHVNLALTHLDLDDSRWTDKDSICMHQYVEVRDGIGLDAPLIGTYCNRKIPPHIVSNGQALTVNVVTLGGMLSSRHFAATYSVDDTACGGSLTAEEGSFASSGYPRSYSLDSECIWQLGASPGNRMELTFSMFDLEASEGCNNDYLEIRYGNLATDPLIGVYCGDQIPNNITASNKLWIKFKSDSANVGNGFLAHYSLKHGGEMTGNNGEIANPMYPKPFTGQGTYWWRITVGPRKKIRITFKELNMNSIGCLTSLRIYDGYDETAPLLKDVCEYPAAADPVVSTDKQVYIELQSNPVYHGSKFLLEWTAEPITFVMIPLGKPTPSCGGVFNISVNGTIEFTSQGFPNGYADSLNCEWLFEAPENYHATLYFNTLSLEQHPRCAFDYVAVYSGSRHSNEWTLINKYCHPNATQLHGVHASDRMKVVFRTDAMTNKTGFSASAIAVCGGSLSGTNGELNIYNLSMPAPFGIYPICEWNVTVRAGRTIIVEILTLDISGGADCSDNYLMFKNGLSADAPLLKEGRYCQSTPPTTHLETTGNKLYIRYNIKQRNLVGGFTLVYRESTSDCGGKYYFNSVSGNNEATIASPNHPRSPPTNTECEWVFMAEPGKRIRIDTSDRSWSFIYSKNCESAYVEYFDGGSSLAPSLGRFCRDAPSSIITSDNSLFVRYVTTAKEPKSGFMAFVVVDVCGGTIRGDLTSITVPELSTNKPVTCVWTIITQSNLLSYSFDAFDMNSNGGPNCTSDYVEVKEVFNIRNLNSISAVLQSQNHQRYCGQTFNRTYVQTGSDRIVVTLNSTRDLGKNAHKYFKMSFRQFHKECGGTLNAPEGEIVSPGYPGSPNKRQVCNWVLTVPEGRRIKVEFVDFDLDGTKANCQQWLGIYNEHSSILPIGLYCGGESPGEISSSSNKMMLQSLTWHTATHRGFKLKFSSDLPTVCDGDIRQNFGSLTFPTVNMSSIYCEWTRATTEVGTLAITVFNASINANLDSSCFRSSKNLLIGTRYHALAQICGTVTIPKIVTNPLSDTVITARQNDLTNRIDFNLAYRFFECGGRLRGPIDTIQSPENMSMDCAWSMSYNYGQINLTLASINFTADCSNQYINIYNGMTPSWPLIGHFCKDNMPPVSILGQSPNMYIEYHGSSSVPAGSGFLINSTMTSAGCGGVFHSSAGLIYSPGFPRVYSNNAECEWEIVVDEGYHIGLKFRNRFFIESSANCSKDFLQVFDYVDDGWKSLGKVCGRDMPKPFNSTANRMKVLFRSDNATAGDGFMALWGVNCGGVIRAQEGYLISPSYPSNYGKFLTCKYSIFAPGKAIRFQFLDFSLEQGFQDCRYDNVTIAKISPMRNRLISANMYSTQTYCGQDAPPDGVSMDRLKVTFQTDKWIEKRGFRMKFSVDDCGGEVNETTLQKNPVLSPSLFASSEMVKANCTWLIKAPPLKNIMLRFETVNIKGSNNCILGSIQMFNSSWTDSKQQMGKLCGNITDAARIFVSKRDEMTLSYNSFRSYIRENPFSVAISFTYGESVGCGGYKNASASERILISSYSSRGTSGNYENMLDCRWYVQANPGQLIKLTVTTFDVKDCDKSSTNSSCQCDYLEVRDGTNQFSPLLGRFCGSTRPDVMVSSGSWLYVRFVSDDFESGRGFMAQISKIASPCGPQLLQVDDTLRELTSPGFASNLNYAPNLRCRWKLRTQEAMRFDIHIVQLDLEKSRGCTNDQLVISEDAEPDDEDEVIHTGAKITSERLAVYSPRSDANHESLFCGQGGQLDWYSRKNRVDILFATNGAVSGKGFKIQYQYARCSRNFTRNFGRIHYQGQTKHQVFSGECTITVSTEPNRTVALYFSELYSSKTMAINNSCNSSSQYKIFDGLSMSSPLLAEYCGVGIPNPVFSTGPYLMIMTKQSGFWSEEGFDATFTTSDKGRGCGGVSRNVAGSLTSPLYPSRARNYTECVWEITVPEGSFVKILFTAFNLGASDTCDTDYLKIFEIETDTKKEIFKTKLCGSDGPAPISANTNSVLLKYTTSIHNSGTGWKLNFAAMKNRLD